jgi:hypothetical protein
MQRNHFVFPKSAPGAADITNNDTEPAARDKDAQALGPHFLQLGQEPLIVVEMSELCLIIDILDEIKVWRGCQDQVN